MSNAKKETGSMYKATWISENSSMQIKLSNNMVLPPAAERIIDELSVVVQQWDETFAGDEGEEWCWSDVDRVWSKIS